MVFGSTYERPGFIGNLSLSYRGISFFILTCQRRVAEKDALLPLWYERIFLSAFLIKLQSCFSDPVCRAALYPKTPIAGSSVAIGSDATESSESLSEIRVLFSRFPPRT